MHDTCAFVLGTSVGRPNSDLGAVGRRPIGQTNPWEKPRGTGVVGGVGGGGRGGGLRPQASRHVAETCPCDGRLFRHARCRTGPYNRLLHP